MDEYNIPTKKPTFCISSIIITTIPLVLMVTGTIRLLVAGGVDDTFVKLWGEILLHLIFCALGGPFASMISILATYIAKERGESMRFCKAARVYAKVVLFACLAFLAIIFVISLVKS